MEAKLVFGSIEGNAGEKAFIDAALKHLANQYSVLLFRAGSTSFFNKTIKK